MKKWFLRIAPILLTLGLHGSQEISKRLPP